MINEDGYWMETKCLMGLNIKEYMDSYCKSLSRGQLEYYWATTFFECLKSGMQEDESGTDLYNVVMFIKGKTNHET
jgi:hypothetical protein